MTNRYGIVVFWSEDDGISVADASDLKIVFGLSELRIAMEAWLGAARENGLPIPEPRFRPATVAAE
jgi:hypothetical protein